MTDSIPVHPDAAPLLEAEGVRVRFPLRGGLFGRAKGWVHAVDNVSLSIRERESVGLVGESGCGKTTLGRAMLLLPPPEKGTIRFRGVAVRAENPADAFRFRRGAQMVFQNPFASLTPRHRVLSLLTEPPAVHGLLQGRREDTAARLLEEVGLPADTLRRYPNELSGGQRQRIGLARALSLSPDLLVCDEAVSALDVSVQAQILNLLMDLRERRGLAYLFISHDLGVVRHLCDRVAVMYLGRLIETGPAREVLASPRHPYTRALMDAVPGLSTAGTRAPRLAGDPPSPVNPPSGCAFHPRCSQATECCRSEIPPEERAGERRFRCFHPLGRSSG